MRTIFIDFKNFKNLDKKRRWRLLWKSLGILAGAGVLLVVGVFLFFAKDLPDPSKINSRVIPESTKILDRTGEHVLYEIHGEEKRTLVDFKNIPDSLKFATIALEDQDFYNHFGIQFTSIVRAALKDIIKGGAAQGASTITQQLVKNSLLTSEKTITRKIKEVILALELEVRFSKDEILGMYLNEIPYGSNAYGVEAAAQTFFGKSVSDLSLDESAIIASLPRATAYYSPYGSHTEVLKARQELALERMMNLGYITEDQFNEAKSVDVLAKIKPFRDNISAPHFVMYVKEYLETKYGQNAMEQGGMKVFTTLDWDKQQIAEKVVKEGAEKNIKSWNAYNSSLVAIDPKTGQILAMVGSKDYFGVSEPAGCVSGKNCKFEPQDNVAIRNRQPGSSFKPYVYLTAFTKGYTPETMLFDVETDFSTDSGKDYKPQNYDGKFRGPIQMKYALPQSLNIPAVETLYLAGVNDSVNIAKSMGITGLPKPDDYGLSLVLGGGEVKLLDHVSAFGTMATGGIKHSKQSILRVEDNKGTILEEYKPDAGERVVDEKYVAMIDHIISTNDYRAPVFGTNSPLRFDDRQVAAKTGTTNEFRDGWIIGYTPSLAVGVWSGNNDNTPMRAGADGVNVSAPIWRAFLDQALKNYAIEQFPKYEEEKTGKDILDGKLNIKKDVKVCEIPGKDKKYCLANDYCPSGKSDKKDFADVHTILYYVDKNNPRGDAPSKPENDLQFKNWEKATLDWFKKDSKDYKNGAVPQDECKKEDFSKYLPSVSLSISKDVLNASISANVNAPYGLKSIEILEDGDKISSGASASFTGETGKSYDISVNIVDNNGNKASASQSVSF
jgi:1A family penicillin-binding protein